MVIAPTSAVHTWFMKFDIDIAFVARDGRVLKARDTVRPWRMTGAFGGFAVIEMKAGSLCRRRHGAAATSWKSSSPSGRLGCRLPASGSGF